nr:hypothetical protein BgiMline_006533 [Biomphalaria glabrata]
MEHERWVEHGRWGNMEAGWDMEDVRNMEAGWDMGDVWNMEDGVERKMAGTWKMGRRWKMNERWLAIKNSSKKRKHPS